MRGARTRATMRPDAPCFATSPSAPSAAAPTAAVPPARRAAPAGRAHGPAGGRSPRRSRAPAFDDDAAAPGPRRRRRRLHAARDPRPRRAHRPRRGHHHAGATPARSPCARCGCTSTSTRSRTSARRSSASASAAGAARAPEDWGWIDVRKLVAARARTRRRSTCGRGAELHRPGDDDETDARVPLPREIAPGETIAARRRLRRQAAHRRRAHGLPRVATTWSGQWFPKVARLEPDGTLGALSLPPPGGVLRRLRHLRRDPRRSRGRTRSARRARWSSGSVADGRRIERHVQARRARLRVDGVGRVADHARDHRRRGGDAPLPAAASSGWPRRELATLRFALPYYSAHYGRYPYTVLTVVHPQQDAGEAGGMEYPTLITTGGSWLTPPGLLAPEIVDAPRDGPPVVLRAGGHERARVAVPRRGPRTSSPSRTAMAKWRGDGSALDARRAARERRRARRRRRRHGRRTTSRSRSRRTRSRRASNYGRLVYARTASVDGDAAPRLRRRAGRCARSAATRGATASSTPGPSSCSRCFEEVLGARVAATLRDGALRQGLGRLRRRGRVGRGGRAPGGHVRPRRQAREGRVGQARRGRLGQRGARAAARHAVVPGGRRDDPRRRHDAPSSAGTARASRSASRGTAPSAVRGVRGRPGRPACCIDMNLENNRGDRRGARRRARPGRSSGRRTGCSSPCRRSRRERPVLRGGGGRHGRQQRAPLDDLVLLTTPAVRARRHPRAILAMWAWETVAGAARQLAGGGAGARGIGAATSAGDAALWAPGSHALARLARGTTRAASARSSNGAELVLARRRGRRAGPDGGAHDRPGVRDARPASRRASSRCIAGALRVFPSMLLLARAGGAHPGARRRIGLRSSGARVEGWTHSGWARRARSSSRALVLAGLPGDRVGASAWLTTSRAPRSSASR